MINKHYSRKQRQLKYLVTQLNNLLQKADDNLKSEIKKIAAKIKFLASQLNGIISVNKMKKILGALALFIGVSFANTASAQYFAYPASNPFGISPGYTNYTQSVNLIDIDNDGDFDLFTDSLTYSYSGGYYSIAKNFNYQENIGTSTNPNFNIPQLNPFNLSPIPNDTSMLIVRHFIDLDDDGDFDVLSNVIYQGYYSFMSKYRYHENIGTSSAPNFASAVLNPFGLQDSPNIEFSAIGDIDNDGDFDLINSSFNYNTYASSFTFTENIGTNLNPTFSTPQTNAFGLPVNTGYIRNPELTDLDSDGDLDIIFGEEAYYGGQFVYHENTGTINSAQFTSPVINPYGLTGSVFESIPTLEFKDLDNDGDVDLLAGTYEKTSYFENVGIQQPVTYECINYSCVDPGTGSGTYATLSSCQTSCIAPVTYDCDWPGNCYDPGDGNGYYATYSDCMLDCTPSPSWDCISPGNCQDPGDGSGWYWSLQDCQNDCAFPATWNCDVTLGCIDPADGTGLYASLSGCQANCNTTSVISTEINNLKLFPNPVNNTLHISYDKKIDKIEIFDNLGRIILSKNNPESKINVEHLANGIYSIAIIFDENRIIKKFTK